MKYQNHVSLTLKATNLRRHQRGFSIFEALFGLILTMIGFITVFRLQGAQMNAGLSARDMSAASNLAEYAVSSLNRESYSWNSPLLTGGRLGLQPNQWHSFTQFPVDHNMQAHQAFDEEQGTVLNRQRFCVHYWFDEMGGLYDGLLSARVRVVWSRDPKNQRIIQTVCGEDQVNNFRPNPAEWHSLTVPIVLRRHP